MCNRVPFSISVTDFIHKREERQREGEGTEDGDEIRVETFTLIFLMWETLKRIEYSIKLKLRKENRKVSTLKVEKLGHETIR